MNDPPAKYWSTSVHCQRVPLFLPSSCSFIHSACNPFSCTGYAPDLFFGDRAFSVSKSWFAHAGAGTALFIAMSLSPTYCAVPRTGDGRSSGMNSARLKCAKPSPRPSTVTIDRSLQANQQ